MAKQVSLKRKWLFTLLPVLVLAVLICVFTVPSKELRSDLQTLSSETYDSAFLSMYPIENYEEEDYAHWRGMDLIKTSHEISNLTTLKLYLRTMAGSGNPVHTVYLGILPGEVAPEDLLAQCWTYPEIQFHVVFPYPSLEYWCSLPEKECRETLTDYYALAETLANQNNVSCYFFGGSQWLISNPANYEDTFLPVESICETLMLHTDRDHAYVLTEENMTSSIQALETLIAEEKAAPAVYPDLKDKHIVFFGDSVIAGYTDSASIPGVVAGLTGAEVYNWGVGGGWAAEYTEDDYFSLSDCVNTFLQNDSAKAPNGEDPLSVRLQENITRYQENESPDIHCFVIHYGFNDYFNGSPVSSEDPYDLYTFEGGLRSSIQKLKDRYPNAQILLSIPTYTVYFDEGREPKGSQGHVLTDYVEALLGIAEETDALLLDNYHELDINRKNHDQLLVDGCHPNEQGRFLLGARMALKLM